MPRCFIVNRVSTEKQKDNLSISIQRLLHPRIADQLGCTYSREDIFDLDVSSTTYDHHKWLEVKKAVASGRYRKGYCVIGAIDRYHRDKPEWFEFMAWLLRFDITVVIPDTTRTHFPPGEKIPTKEFNPQQFHSLLQMIFEIEEAESFKRKLKARVKSALSHARDSGVDIAGTGAESFGHRWDPGRTVMIDGRGYGRWVPKVEEEKIVKILFTKDLRAVEMAQWLNTHGYKSKKGKQWTSTAIYRVRRQLRLAGKMRSSSGDIIDARNVIPIVTYKQWIATQQLIARREIHRKPSLQKYALIGLVGCGYCHDAGKEINMTRTIWGGGRPEQSRLYCQRKRWKSGSPACLEKGRAGYSLLGILRLVNKDLLRVLGTPAIYQKAVRDYRRKHERSSRPEEIKRCEDRLRRTSERIRNLTQAVEEGYDRNEAIDRLNALKDERESLQQELLKLQRPIERLTSIPPYGEASRLLEKLLTTQEAIRDNPLLFRLHDTFIDRILLYADRAEIHYKYFSNVTLKLTSDILASPRKINIPALMSSYKTSTMTDLTSTFKTTKNAIRLALRRNGVTLKDKDFRKGSRLKHG